MTDRLAPETVVDGRYRIEHRLGSGGMADVYCAKDLQLGRSVALKVLHRRFAEDSEFVERFRREASAAAGLQHRHVVVGLRPRRVGGHLLHRDGVPRGPHAEGADPEEAPLDPDRAVDLTIQILRAARFAHQRGIIHRDLKPHNVIVDDEGRGEGHGLRHRPRRRVGHDADRARSWARRSTSRPSRPRATRSAPQSDLYSVGIILYEMLTGARAVRRRERRHDRAQAGQRGAARRRARSTPPCTPALEAWCCGR